MDRYIYQVLSEENLQKSVTKVSLDEGEDSNCLG